MNKIKKVLLVAFIIFMFLGVLNTKVEAKEKVNVYVFEAVGCPACGAQIEYLNELKKTNDKFNLVVKELYKNTSDWTKSTDYELGVKVANAFVAKGYRDATYQATPFVVIGTKYAISTYNNSLEDVINLAYEEEQTDIVKCIESGKSGCEESIFDISHLNAEEDAVIKESKEEQKEIDNLTKTFLGIAILGGAGVYLSLRNKRKNEVA